MSEKELLTKKFKMVYMDEVGISMNEMTIIGTEALATCVGVLLYSEEKKRAIVGHASDDIESILCKIMEIINENELNNTTFKYMIIAGTDYNSCQVELESFFSSIPHAYIPFDKDKIPDNAIVVDKETNSCEFAFDSLTGKFVTDKVLFGRDYLNINQEEIIDLNTRRCR